MHIYMREREKDRGNGTKYKPLVHVVEEHMIAKEF